ncbi:MAG: hypothetical protein U1E93_02960 [Alphaproteobacteria bacterium]
MERQLASHAPNKSRRDRALGWGFTAGVHAVLTALFWPRHHAPQQKAQPELQLTLLSVEKAPEPPRPA